MWWGFGWISLSLLEYWSVYLRSAIGVRVALATWLPPLVMLSVAALAWSLLPSLAAPPGEPREPAYFLLGL